ncbi:MAG: hypothetical protein KKH28_06895 [Elusimicrobia bacterium]|nr:hypothetical protein [Elusimicrobiota bacterium]
MNQRIEDLAHISQQTTELLLAQLLSYALQESRKYDWASGVKKGEYIHGNTVLTKGKSPEAWAPMGTDPLLLIRSEPVLCAGNSAVVSCF